MTQEHKNLYEDLIEGMIIEGINGMTPELQKLITDAPVEKQRSMILDIMEENNPEHRLLCNKIHTIMKRGVTGEMSHIKEVVKMLREYVKVSDVEVKKYGEIMTPIELVEEMLDTLPATVWMSPNLKWLDPCNGVGTFISVVVQRLMKGLEWTIPNEQERYRHIMEEMIYVCELQPKNVFLYMYAFDPEDRYALNIYNGSYLSEGFNKHMADLGIEKFDVIVMNPPYNTDSINGKTEPLWNKFVHKSINVLIEDGHLVAVHPSGWRNPDGKFKDVQTLLKSKQLLYLEIHNVSDGVKTFGVSTRYDFYCLHNVSCTLNTKIKGEDGKTERVDLSKMEFIPNGMFNEIKKLVASKNEVKVHILQDSSYHTQRTEQMSRIKTEENIHPCIMNVNIQNEISCIWFSNINTKGHFGIPKVIFGRRSSGVLLDINGEYGLTQDAYSIIDDEDKLPYIQKALLNPKFIELSKQCDFGGLNSIYNHKILKLFRKDFWMDFI